jgi:acyl-CoA dehydrogenase
MTPLSLRVALLALPFTLLAGSARAQEFSMIPDSPRAEPAPPPPPAPAAPEPPAPRFGERGELVMTGDSYAGVSSTERDGSDAKSFSVTVSPALDYFVAKNLSVGLNASFGYGDSQGYGADSSLVETKTTSASFGPAIGYNVPLGDALSLWPRASVGFEWSRQAEQLVTGSSLSTAGSPLGYPTTSRVGPFVALYAPLLVHPRPHFFAGIGPYFFHDFGPAQGGPSVGGERTTVGAYFIVGGWLGGRGGDPPAPAKPELRTRRFGDAGEVVLTSDIYASAFGRTYAGSPSSSSSVSFGPGFDCFVRHGERAGRSDGRDRHGQRHALRRRHAHRLRHPARVATVPLPAPLPRLRRGYVRREVRLVGEQARRRRRLHEPLRAAARSSRVARLRGLRPVRVTRSHARVRRCGHPESRHDRRRRVYARWLAMTLASVLDVRERRPVASLESFLSMLHAIDEPPFDAALLGGALADRPAYAFVAGIRAALAALAPDTPKGAVVSLCATEAHGAHPRSIETRLDERTRALTGEKRWATMSPRADVLLVLAKTGEAAGRSVLRLARIDARAPGVHIEPMPETPFAPEVPHATVTFSGAVADAVLAGDGYEDYVKPFRTAEDVHVLAALLAYVVAEARGRAWPHAFVEDALAAICALRGVADLPRLDAATHVAVGGALRMTGAVLEAADAQFFAARPEDVAAQRWARDKPLRSVAERARVQRLEAAWSRLGAS